MGFMVLVLGVGSWAMLGLFLPYPLAALACPKVL